MGGEEKNLYWPDLVVEERDSFFSNAERERARRRESLMPLRHASADISHLACLCFCTVIFMVRVCSEGYSYSSLLICFTRLLQATLVSAHYLDAETYILVLIAFVIKTWKGKGIFNKRILGNKWSLGHCMDISTVNLHCGSYVLCFNISVAKYWSCVALLTSNRDVQFVSK